MGDISCQPLRYLPEGETFIPGKKGSSGAGICTEMRLRHTQRRTRQELYARRADDNTARELEPACDMLNVVNVVNRRRPRMPTRSHNLVIISMIMRINAIFHVVEQHSSREVEITTNL